MSASDVNVSIKADLSEYQDAIRSAALETLIASGMDADEAAEQMREWDEIAEARREKAEADEARWRATVDRHEANWRAVIELLAAATLMPEHYTPDDNTKGGL